MRGKPWYISSKGVHPCPCKTLVGTRWSTGDLTAVATTSKCVYVADVEELGGKLKQVSLRFFAGIGPDGVCPLNKPRKPVS